MERIVTDPDGVKVPQQIVVLSDAAGNPVGNPVAPIAGQKKIAVTNTAVPLAAVATPLSNGAVIRARADNGAAVLVGAAGVLTTNDGTGNGYPLLAGEAISSGTADLAAIFINGTAGDGVDFLAS